MNNDVTAGYIVADVERLRKPMQLITDNLLKLLQNHFRNTFDDCAILRNTA